MLGGGDRGRSKERKLVLNIGGVYRQHGSAARVGPFGGRAGEPENGFPRGRGGRRRLTATNITGGHRRRHD